MGLEYIDGSKDKESRAVINELGAEVSLGKFRVVGSYVRYNDAVRNYLKNMKQMVVNGLQAPTKGQENYLIWGLPGSGKSYFVDNIAHSLGNTIYYKKINLAEMDELTFGSDLSKLEQVDKSRLCFVDEIDSKSSESWPYVTLIPHLAPSNSRKSRTCFIMAGSGGSNISEMKEKIRSGPKGPDLLDRVLRGTNEYEVPSLNIGDKLVIELCQLIKAARDAGLEICEVEKFALHYIALDSRLGTARQLSDFAETCIGRIPPGEDRVKYDHLFHAGDPDNKEFYEKFRLRNRDLVNSFVFVKDDEIQGVENTGSKRHSGISSTKKEIIGVKDSREEQEKQLLIAFEKDPKITIGGLQTHCQVFPRLIWEDLSRARNIESQVFEYYDDHIDDENSSRVIIVYHTGKIFSIPIESQEYNQELKEAVTSPKLNEKQRRIAADVLYQINEVGQNAYPRIVSLPSVETKNGISVLTINLASSLFGLHSIDSNSIELPSILREKGKHCLNSLGVRAAFTYHEKGKEYCLFHQRGEKNQDHKYAWDIGAAGYIDPNKKGVKISSKRLSAWKAAKNELDEELFITVSGGVYPTNEGFAFFGLTRDTVTHTITLFGECKGTGKPDIKRIKRNLGKRVQEVQKCEIKPIEFANFIKNKAYWVPEAIITAVFVLARRFAFDDIRKVFEDRNLGNVDLRP